jgi:crotonobetainyl-CoA:carnitine CoA-transferase CaiB-like acyl-CoA transferase
VGHVLAVPYACALLGAMGARVTKVEDPERLDMYRRHGPYIDQVPGIDRSAYFAMFNHSKASAAVSLSKEPEQLAKLLDEADVVIENLGPWRSRRPGLDAASLSSARPHLLAVSSSGFGHTGPLSDYRAYAYNLHAFCGAEYLTRTPTGEPAQIEMAWADLISGIALATVVAAWAVSPDGAGGAAVDFSMAELVAQRFNEHVAAGGSASSVTAPGPAPDSAVHLVCTTRDQRFLAVSLDGRSDVDRLLHTLGRTTGPVASENAADEIALLIRDRDAHAVVQQLHDAGVASSVVMSPDDLVADRQLRERGYFSTVTHPEWGERQLLGVPWVFVGEARPAITASPELRMRASQS